MSTTKINTCDKDWFGKDYVFYDKNGNPMNILYDETLDIYNGKQYFPEGSSDTFEELELNIFERIRGYEYQQYTIGTGSTANEILTKKFQLFNTEGIGFRGNTESVSVEKIESVNRDPNFYSKWVHGTKMDLLFPHGTEVKLSRSLYSMNGNETYTVVNSKQNAILVITSMDNKTFSDTFGGSINDSNTYLNITISGVNIIKIYDYINSDYENNFPDWSEPNFYTDIFINQKITIVNSESNNNIVTVKNESLGDNYYHNFKLLVNDMTDDLSIEVTNKTSNFKLYTGNIEFFNSDSSIELESTLPYLLKPGTSFNIPLSVVNNIELTMDSVDLFNNTFITYYSDGGTSSRYDQVIYEDEVYHCIQSYTQSATSSIVPTNTEYWTLTNFLYVTQTITDEFLGNVDIFSDNNKVFFNYIFDNGLTQRVNMASAFEKFRDELNSIELEPYIDTLGYYGIIKSKFPTYYVDVKYFIGGATSSVEQKEEIIERVIEINEDLNDENNFDISTRPERRVLIDDIDGYGLKIIINGQEYNIESTLIYRNNSELDLEESIDETIKSWVTKFKVELDKRGFEVYTENFSINNLTTLHNCIFIRGVYANIPLYLETKVGDTANFEYPDKNVIFHQMGTASSVVTITINNVNYIESYDTSISTTLNNWVISNRENLNDKGIYIEQKNQSLYFSKKTDININIKINVGKLFLPGEKVFEIIEYWITNEGLILTSNQIIQNNLDISFETECFSTGQIISINNSEWVLNNQEYNITFLDPNKMILSYQGPFWGTIDNNIQSAFFELSFGDDLVIGQSILAIVNAVTVTGVITNVGSSSYQILYNGNQIATIERTNAWSYDPGATNSTIASMTQSATYVEVGSNLTDIEYYTTNYKLNTVNDSSIFLYPTDLRISGTVSGTSETIIKTISNPVNGYLYHLTSSFVYVIDPMTDILILTINNINTGYDICVDPIRGDVFISLESNEYISRITSDFTSSAENYYGTHSYGTMVYSRDDDSIYVFSRLNADVSVSGDKVIYRIDLENNDRDLTFLINNEDDLGLDDKYLGTTISNHLAGKIHYNEYNGDLYIGNSGTLHLIDTSNEVLVDNNITTNVYYSVAYDNINKMMWISNAANELISITENSIKNIYTMSSYYNLLYNDNDSNLYMASQDGSNELYVYSTYINQIFYTFSLDFEIRRMTFNKSSNSINGINPFETQVVNVPIGFISYQLKSFSNIYNQTTSYNSNNLDSGQFGIYDEDYVENPLMYLTTRDFIRRPRKNYNTTGAPQVEWEITWEDDRIESIFLVDITGDHLIDSGSYTYIGETPLKEPILRRVGNKNLDLVGDSSAQQTIFSSLTYTLDYNDSQTNVSFIPVGLQNIIGFNSKVEGVISNTLKIIQKEVINVDFLSYESYVSIEFSTTLSEQVLSFYNNLETGNGEIIFNINSTDTFDKTLDLDTFIQSNTNLEEGHIIKIKIKVIDSTKTYDSLNNNMIVKIIKVFQRKLVVEYLDDSRMFTDESMDINNLYLTVNIDVQPKEIVSIEYYGQTEIEDIRYETELRNTGKQVNAEDVYIFKEYDINEGGQDWTYLNAKRKEMLMVRNDIYNYIGAYRSIINSINYFGYNDLELYEYFRNIDDQSENFEKLSKVEIPDIFDNNIKGWTEEYRKYQYPNKKYEETKLFNLTYKFTDFDGVHQQTYSLEEAIIKLSGLKKWLHKNIVPITHKILDITGRMDFRDDNQVYHTPSAVTTITINDYITPVDFNINEIYVLPIQSGSTVYNSVVEFNVSDEETIVDYFELLIKTYKIYDEWLVFTNYNYGEKVSYYGKIYENVLIDNTSSVLEQDPTDIKNTSNNPKEYDEVEEWIVNNEYKTDDLVRYDRNIYKYSLQTEIYNYSPWSMSPSTSCLTENTDDNFYEDLLDRINNEDDIPTYWIDNDNNESNFDVVDIIKDDYTNDWCLVLDRDEDTINNVSISLVNLPSDQFLGTKPQTKEEALLMINTMINDYELVRNEYKVKEKVLSPYENILLDTPNFILWDNITKWLEIDLEPVQTITEFRSGDSMLLPFNFTLDTKIDPYVVVSCKSDNGYGQIKNIKKSYEIKFDADSKSILILKELKKIT